MCFCYSGEILKNELPQKIVLLILITVIKLWIIPVHFALFVSLKM